MTERHSHAVHGGVVAGLRVLPDGAAGIDAGLTLTKIARGTADGIVLEVRESRRGAAADGRPGPGERIGVTGALTDGGAAAQQVVVPEIDAAARGTAALLEAEGRLGDGVFLLALLGTGTACAAVRGEGVTYLGGTALGGGSFWGIGARIAEGMSYDEMISAAERGDRRNVDAMIADAYPDGIGRIGPELTAAHLSRTAGGSLDDVLAGLLNLHGENIAQIVASRALMARVPRVVLAGGFVHGNPALVSSITSMAARFRVEVEVAAHAGFVGAVGAALMAAPPAPVDG